MRTLLAIFAAAFFAVAIIGCDNGDDPVSIDKTSGVQTVQTTPDQELANIEASKCPGPAACPTPALVRVSFANKNIDFWPYTGSSFSGEPQDPINLIFVGKADPREIRAALMSLDGDRTALGFPPVAPFNSRWQDAIGDVQTGYSRNGQWTGGVVQLACGDYEPVRFHIRLFKMGEWTVANAHFEALIPKTTDHQVLSWELAEQFVVADLMRSGLLSSANPMAQTDIINEFPFRTIPAVIYNGLPVDLRQLIGGPLGDVSADVPIGSDGHATILHLALNAPGVYGTKVQDFVINFDQVIPKPFCSSGVLDYVYVQGPVHLVQTTHQERKGNYSFEFHANGNLTITPFDPQTMQPSGPSYAATVSEMHSGSLNNFTSNCSSTLLQRMTSSIEEQNGLKIVRLRVGPCNAKGYQKIERCGAEAQTGY